MWSQYKKCDVLSKGFFGGVVNMNRTDDWVFNEIFRIFLDLYLVCFVLRTAVIGSFDLFLYDASCSMFRTAFLCL